MGQIQGRKGRRIIARCAAPGRGRYVGRIDRPEGQKSHSAGKARHQERRPSIEVEKASVQAITFSLQCNISDSGFIVVCRQLMLCSLTSFLAHPAYEGL